LPIEKGVEGLLTWKTPVYSVYTYTSGIFNCVAPSYPIKFVGSAISLSNVPAPTILPSLIGTDAWRSIDLINKFFPYYALLPVE
jgi:hypothetical protein